MDIFSAFSLIGGLAFFLFGMNVMSSNLEKMAGGKLELLLKKMTSNPLVSMALGAVITIAIQSSSATTVMLVGLVNSGIMEFGQTINVIFGANMGTTLTAWILSLSGIESGNVFIQMLKPENFSPIVAFIGILMLMLSKNDKRKSIGTVCVGFAVLMYGMDLMKNAVSPLAELPQFSEMMVRFNNPLLGVLIGTLFTGLIQSSAATVGILQALSLTGSITYAMAIPIVMGTNIGTCVTSLLSCIGTNSNAKRVAVVHVSIKIIGTLILLPLMMLANAVFTIPLMEQATNPFTIALIHTIFNIAITVILLPFTKSLIKLSTILVRETAPVMETGKASSAPFLDPRLLSTPSIAVAECAHKAMEMANLSKQAIFDAIALLGNYSQKDADQIRVDEDVIDLYEDKLGSYLVQLSGRDLSETDTRIASKVLHTIGDFERLGDHALNLTIAAQEIHDKNLHFSEYAMQELEVLTLALSEILTRTVTSFTSNNFKLAAMVEPLEQVMDTLIEEVKSRHIDRLQRGMCTIELGFVLSDILTNYERISDHCSNIAVAVIEARNDSFESHEYLHAVKKGADFEAQYKAFLRKYSLPARAK